MAKMNTTFMICAFLAMLAVLAVLGLGLYAMLKGKDSSNRFMQARIYLQGLALALLALAYFTSQT